MLYSVEFEVFLNALDDCSHKKKMQSRSKICILESKRATTVHGVKSILYAFINVVEVKEFLT